ncbi:MAG: hypothetical protein HC770_13675 [Pseudanabaena sp. CRU_2_10]|nr:hypothetical protein [Pseudanabaena sp. CRU_2_10]
MVQSIEPSIRIPMSSEFFCDGHYYVLTSSSLGESNYTPLELANILRGANAPEIEALLRQGVCIPLYFEADCALDGFTLFVIGDLTEEESDEWIGKFVAKLNVPCGKLVLLCGGGDEEMITEAISGNPPDPNYVVFQAIDLPPGDYQVEIYAYLQSTIARCHLEDYKEAKKGSVLEWFNWQDYEDLEDGDIGYIIRLIPFTTEPPLPKLDPDIGWCSVFEFRESEWIDVFQPPRRIVNRITSN